MEALKKLFIAACIAGFICLMVFVIVPLGFHEDKSYSGQEVFLTIHEFEEFKNDFKMRVYEDDLKVGTFDVIASEPPVIVNFEVSVPYDYELPYGTTSLWEGLHTFLWVFVSVLLGCAIIIFPLIGFYW